MNRSEALDIINDRRSYSGGMLSAPCDVRTSGSSTRAGDPSVVRCERFRRAAAGLPGKDIGQMARKDKGYGEAIFVPLDILSRGLTINKISAMAVRRFNDTRGGLTSKAERELVRKWVWEILMGATMLEGSLSGRFEIGIEDGIVKNRVANFEPPEANDEAV
jgi:hypothetical protein